MQKLLKTAAFDIFEIKNLSVTHFIQFDIDGALLKEGAGEKQYAAWQELKPYVLFFIKGNTKPKKIKIVFSIPKENLQKNIPGLAAAFLNMEYENDEVRFITAVSQKEFSLSKEANMLWDEFIQNFFLTNEITVEEIT